MRKLIATAFTIAFTLTLITFTRSASPQQQQQQREESPDSCSCSASDGSCSVSITCTGGCIKNCGNNNNCYAYCAGSYAFLGTEVTFEIQNGKYPQFVDKLARLSGKGIEFSPTNPDAVFTVGFSKATLWDALKVLSDHGTVRIEGQDFEEIKRLRRSLLSGERISFSVTTTVNAFVNDMVGLTGLPLRITAGRPMAKANVKLNNASIGDIIAAVSTQTGTKIIDEGTGLGPQ